VLLKRAIVHHINATARPGADGQTGMPLTRKLDADYPRVFVRLHEMSEW